MATDRHQYIYMRLQSSTVLFAQFKEVSGNLTKTSEGGLHIYDLLAGRGSNTYIFPNGYRFKIDENSLRPRLTMWDDNNNQLFSATYSDQVGSSSIKDLYLVVRRYDDNGVPAWLNFNWVRKSSDNSWYYVDTGALALPQYSLLLPYFGDSYDPYSTEDNQTPDGGYGGFDYTGDSIDVPTLPTISASECGFVGLYNPTLQEMKDLADYMWTGTFDLTNFKKLFGDPMECILSVGIVPVTPPRSSNKVALKFANVNSGVSCYKVPKQFVTEDCGSVTISGSKFSNSAMDYSPYTKANLFLPYCGTHSLDIDDIMDATVSIVYHIDLYTGVCVAHVKITKTNSDGSTLNSVLYQFTGNALCYIPITGNNHSQFIQSALFAAAAVGATVASSGAAAPAAAGAEAGTSAAAAGGALTAQQAGVVVSSGINTVMSMKPNVLRSGNLSSNAGFLGLQKPYITLTSPNLCRPDEEYRLCGMPLQKSGKLKDYTGYTVVSAVHMDQISCTETELAMIEQALLGGVIV